LTMLYNQSGSFGMILDAFTYNITGDLFLTLLCIVLIIIAFCLMFRIPIEYSIIIILPLLLVCMAFTSQFLAIGGVALIYIAVLLAKNFLIK
jgi:lipopolysaccharide export LptBFGC system permease protein LptF